MIGGDGQLEEIFERCEGAYAPKTLANYATDLGAFVAFCRARGAGWLPAEPETVAGFVDYCVDHFRISTIRRRLSAISFAHRMSELPSPVERSIVQLALRRAQRKRPSRPDQRGGLTMDILERILDACPDSFAGLRDAALLSVGYDTLCRSVELAAMQVNHLRLIEREASVLIPRSKADAAGDGRVAHLSPRTAKLLELWLDRAEILEGPVFRGVRGSWISAKQLETSTIRRLIKAAAWRADVEDNIVDRLSGHSMRIGAAQDMMTTGFDSLSIMQSGGWKSPHVVLRYVENASTKKLHERRWRKFQREE